MNEPVPARRRRRRGGAGDGRGAAVRPADSVLADARRPKQADVAEPHVEDVVGVAVARHVGVVPLIHGHHRPAGLAASVGSPQVGPGNAGVVRFPQVLVAGIGDEEHVGFVRRHDQGSRAARLSRCVQAAGAAGPTRPVCGRTKVPFVRQHVDDAAVVDHDVPHVAGGTADRRNAVGSRRIKEAPRDARVRAPGQTAIRADPDVGGRRGVDPNPIRRRLIGRVGAVERGGRGGGGRMDPGVAAVGADLDAGNAVDTTVVQGRGIDLVDVARIDLHVAAARGQMPVQPSPVACTVRRFEEPAEFAGGVHCLVVRSRRHGDPIHAAAGGAVGVGQVRNIGIDVRIAEGQDDSAFEHFAAQRASSLLPAQSVTQSTPKPAVQLAGHGRSSTRKESSESSLTSLPSGGKLWCRSSDLPTCNLYAVWAQSPA